MKTGIFCLLSATILLHAASFEAASVKPADPATYGSHSDSDGSMLTMRNVTLKLCIRQGWGVPESRILEGPKWLETSRFDIDARAEHKVGRDEFQSMIQSLLAERFHLTLHHETRPIAGFVLTSAKSAMKMKVSAPGTRSHDNGSRGHMDATSLSMDQLVRRLTDILGVPVVNETALHGAFDFSLSWSPEGDIDAPSPPLSVAVQEQLGLKLEARKLPVDMLIIDRAELPSEN